MYQGTYGVNFQGVKRLFIKKQTSDTLNDSEYYEDDIIQT